MSIRAPRRLALAATVALAVTLVAPVTSEAAAPTPGAAIKVAVGGRYTIVIGADGVPYATGSNQYGQLTGTGDRTELAAMTGLPAGVRATAASAGQNQSVILGSDGVAYGAGSNDHSQLTGTGDRSTLTPLTGLPGGVQAKAVAASPYDTLVLGSDGVAYGAGYNSAGQLTGADSGDVTTLTPLLGLPAGVKAAAIASGDFHSLVLGSDGVAYGTGDNSAYQLTGMDAHTSLAALTGLPAGVTAIAVAAGRYHSLVLGSDGVPYATGSNNSGQVTGASDVVTLTPMTGLPVGQRATAIAASSNVSLVLGADHVPYATGSNSHGQLTGTDARSTLTPMSGPGTAGTPVAIAVGMNDALVVTTDGVVLGAGANDFGQLTGSAVADVTVLTAFTSQVVAPVVAPTITGPAVVGTAVSATPGSWAPVPDAFTYQWRLDEVAIVGATEASYVPVVGDVGGDLSVTVTAARVGSVTGASTSAALTVTAAPQSPLAYVAKAKPTIGGKAVVGKRLVVKHASKSAWSPHAATLGFQWLRGKHAIPGATTSSYKLTNKDAGARIAVRVLGKLAGYPTGSVTSKPTAKVKK